MTLTGSATRAPVAAPDPPAVLRPVLARAGRALATVAGRYWTVAAFVLAWQAWAVLGGYNRIVVPLPAEVVGDVLGNPGVYVPDLAATVLMATGGLVAGMAVGVLGAVAVWASPIASGMVTPAALVMRSVPVVAMIPVLARVFGYGWPTVLAITTVVSFFPAFVFVGARLREPPRAGADLFAVLGAGRARTLRLLLLPHAVPGLLVAFRLTAPSAVLAALLAEYLMGGSGLGTLFARSISFYEVERAWGTALVATAVSVACFVGARAVERRGLARTT